MRRLKSYFILMFAWLCIFAMSGVASASNSGVTYQGRILKPDGTPLAGANTQFKMQIRTPGSSSCLMYEELQSQNLSSANGAFSITINDGSGSRTDTTGLTLDKIFANHGSLTLDPTTCTTGTGVYTPSTDDGRSLVVLFKDETMSTWEPIPAQKINFVPFAFEAKQVQGFTADSIFKVVDGSGNPQLGISPLSNAQYTALLALSNGTSTAYTAAGQLNGSAMPTMTSGQVLGWNGTSWVSTSATPAANSVTSTMLQSSSVTTSAIANNVTINTSGTVGAAITTTRDFKIYAASPSTFAIDMQAPALTASYSLVWPLTAGSSNQVLTTDGSGNLSWAAPANSSQWATNGSNISYVAGNVGIGTTSPSAPLEVAGNITATGLFLNKADAFTNETIQNSSSVASRYPGLTINNWAGTTSGYPMLIMQNARGNSLTSTPMNSGDTLAMIQVNGVYNATNSVYAPAGVRFIAAENFSATSAGTHIVFSNATLGSTSSSEKMRISASGNIGIGTTAPTAVLNIKAGSATAGTAPLKFTTGPLLTTPEDGAMEYLTSGGLYFTVGSTRYVIPTNTTAGNYSGVSNISNSGGSITLAPAASSGTVYVNSGTVSTGTSSGALTVSGGVGVSGDIYAGATINAGSTVNAVTSVVTPQVYGSSTASGTIKIDGTSNVTKGNVLLATAGGSVGIGTTAPGYTLDVAGTLNATGKFTGRSFTGAATDSTTYTPTSASLNAPGTGAATLSQANGTGADGSGSYLNLISKNTASNPQTAYMGSISTTGTGVFSPAIVIGQQTGAASYNERIRIDGSGNVGIGTTAPQVSLDVNGALRSTPSFAAGGYIESAYAGADPAQTLQRWSGTSNQFYGFRARASNGVAFFENTNALPFASQIWNPVLAMTQSGNVGIGTTAPTNTLDVENNVNSQTALLTLKNNSSGISAGSGLQTSNDNNSAILRIYTTSSGNTNSFAAASRNVIEAPAGGIDIAATSTSSASTLRFFTNGINERLRIDSAGNVGIGTTLPTAKLNLAAGTTSLAPFKLTSSGAGVLLSTPQDGAMEYDGTGLWFTIGSSRFVIPTNTASGNYSSVSNISNSAGSITLAPAASSGTVYVNSGTISTGTSSGALTVSGGVGVSGDIFAGATINAGTSVNAATSVVTPQIYGSSAASGNIKIDGTSNVTKGSVLLASAGGNVGIGTTSPLDSLHVEGSANGSSAGHIIVKNTFDGTAALGSVMARNAANVATEMGTVAASYTSLTAYPSGSGFLRTGSANGLSLATQTASAIRLYTGGEAATNERMRIDSIGNVGIGTTAPGYLLHVRGAGTSPQFAVQRNTNSTDSALFAIYPAGTSSSSNVSWLNGMAVNSNDYRIQYNDGTNTYTPLTISNAGNVGIGTTSPTTAFDIASATTDTIETIRSSVASSTAGLSISANSAAGANATTMSIGSYSPSNLSYIKTYTDSRLYLGTQNSDALMIAKGTEGRGVSIGSYTNTIAPAQGLIVSGNVGIGTTAPGQKLSVAGAVESTTGGFRFPDATTQLSAATVLGEFIANDTEPSSSTGGGTCTTGSFQTRVLNTTVLNTIAGASLATNQISLPAGTYVVEGSAPASSTGNHQAIFYNVSAGTNDIIGTVEQSTSGSGITNHSEVVGKLVLTGPTVFELRHACSGTQATYGFGKPPAFGISAVYSIVKIRRIQ